MIPSARRTPRHFACLAFSAAMLTAPLGIPHAAAQDPALQAVRGTVVFPEGAEVPGKGAAFVELRDAEVKDGMPAVAQQRIPLAGAADVFPFTLQIDRGRLDDKADYMVRATVLDGQTPTWISDEVPVDTGSGDVSDVTLTLKPFKNPPADEQAQGASRLPDIHGLEWVVDTIDGAGVIETSDVALNFGVDGSLSGSASCNTFKARYAVDQHTLQVSNLALTERACSPELMKQERTFIDILSHAASIGLDADGGLVVKDAQDRAIRASSE